MLRKNRVVTYMCQNRKLPKNSFSFAGEFLMLDLNKQLENAFIGAILMYFYKQNLLKESEYLRIKENLEAGNKYVDNNAKMSDV